MDRESGCSPQGEAGRSEAASGGLLRWGVDSAAITLGPGGASSACWPAGKPMRPSGSGGNNDV